MAIFRLRACSIFQQSTCHMHRVPQKTNFQNAVGVTGTPCVWKLIFWSFLAKTKPDQAFASHVHGKI